MQLLSWIKNQILSSQAKFYRWLILFIAGILSFSLLGVIHPSKTQGVELPSAPLEIASNWKSASFPVENFQAYTSPFGYRQSPTGGSQEFHNGLDLAAPLGSYIRNWWSGQIIEVSDHTACGTMIRVQSGQWTHIYCHMMGKVEQTPQGRYLSDPEGGIQLWQGQILPVATRIGRVGMTGRTTGPHLHWSLKYGNSYVDPALVLQEMYKQQTVSRIRSDLIFGNS
jgi:murein DD-endopeptidase MepM/ murein hydrolase activator NlpD